MKTAIALITLAALAGYYTFGTTSTTSDVEAKFQDFVSTYRKSYLNAETYDYRLGVFAANLEEIAQMQAENPRAEYGVTHLADLTKEERLAMLTWKAPTGPKNYRNTRGSPKGNDKNWVDENEVTPIKDQGSCGSCWAFAGIETLESAYALAHGLSGDDIPRFSEQQMVDCAKYPEYGSMGCQGGWMDDVFEYASKNKICTEEEYAYTARDGTCQAEKCTFETGVTGTVNIPEGDVQALLEADEVVPVSIAVDASSWSFYRGGIHTCKTQNLNHGVQLDGFHINSEDGDYLLVRNSWGARWGESGFIKLDVEGNCGAALAASYPQFGNTSFQLPGTEKCDDGKDADPAINCLCTYGGACDKTKPQGENGCKTECGCGEFGFCR
jgi:C1A family cysteine protease